MLATQSICLNSKYSTTWYITTLVNQCNSWLQHTSPWICNIKQWRCWEHSIVCEISHTDQGTFPVCFLLHTFLYFLDLWLRNKLRSSQMRSWSEGKTTSLYIKGISALRGVGTVSRAQILVPISHLCKWTQIWLVHFRNAIHYGKLSRLSIALCLYIVCIV